MKRSPFSRRGRAPQDVELLARLAEGLSQSASRVEDGYWETRLADIADRLLASGDEATLNMALDKLANNDSRAYEELADVVEARSESLVLQSERGPRVGLLVAIPVVAWSRVLIPARTIPKSNLQEIQTQLTAHVLAADTQVVLADYLFSPDQLPGGFCETAALAARLAAALPGKGNLHIDPEQLKEAVQFLSDTRYVIGLVSAPAGGAVFRWQEDDGSVTASTEAWTAQGGAVLSSLLPSCATRYLLPRAYFAACREADRELRPYSIKASVDFLTTTLNVPSSELSAAIGPFHGRRLEEYRVGFMHGDASTVIHGVVWPLLEAEDEGSDIPGQIEAILREVGIKEIHAFDERFPLEYCDDCGAPLYPNAEADPVHTEFPESEASAPAQLH